MKTVAFVCAFVVIASLPSLGDEPVCPDYNPLKNPYVGDLHDHTMYSLDAYGFGNRQDPLDAFSYAMGMPINVSGRIEVIDRRLDFAIVSDHSEFLDVVEECYHADQPEYGTPYCVAARDLAEQHQATPCWAAATCGFEDRACIASNAPDPSICADDPNICATATANVWVREQQIANSVNSGNLCSFTTFNAYEWTAIPLGNTMHRIVLFRDDNVPAVPLDYLHYPSVTSLMSNLSLQCNDSTGCDVITIPHNSNLSGGMAWEFFDPDSEPALRAQYDVLAEIHQHKGNSECQTDPQDSGSDPLCNFEIVPNTDSRGYLREALNRGISYYAENGSNPFHFGFVGGTDNHNATPGNVNESTYHGHLAVKDNEPLLRLTNSPENNPGGITVVWAEQNTRASLFAALKRREVYATSGPRIIVRFYQTWNDVDYCADPAFPQQLIQDGAIPMGGTFSPVQGGAPNFVVFAMQDETQLASAQLIKGSLVAGQPQEAIVPIPVGDPTSFCTIISDPEYDPSSPAYYYVRVLEQETPRWSSYDCHASADTEAYCQAHPELDVMIQERAWTSPIYHLVN